MEKKEHKKTAELIKKLEVYLKKQSKNGRTNNKHRDSR
jgi:hypothetical protein